MNIFQRIIVRVFGVSPYTEKDHKITERINQLSYEKKAIDKELEKITTSSVEDLKSLYIQHKPSAQKEYHIFTPPEPIKVRTMKELYEQRTKEEVRRLAGIRQEIGARFDKIESLIQKEVVDRAENLLFETTPLLKEVKDEELNSRSNELLSQISELKEILLQREIKRREEEERQRIELENRRKEEERKRREKEEAERLRKEEEARRYEEQLRQQEEKRRTEIENLRATVTQQKQEAQDIISYLNLKGVRYFYHFTDHKNLASIRLHKGLYSWYYCQQHDISIPDPGGDCSSRQLDMNKGLQDYVRLSFCDDHPMAWRKHQEGSDLVLLRIKIDVATFRDTLFSDINAAANGVSFGKDIEDLQKVNIMATKRHYVSRDDPAFHEHQAECMVKRFIPIEYIENINNPKTMLF